MNRRHRDRTGEAGFTLIEVLVAFTILGFALVALLDIFSTGMRNVKVSEDYTTATAFAESKLATIGVVEPLVGQVQTGTFDGRFTWESAVRRIEVGPRADIEATVEPYQVTVTVNWGAREDGRGVALTTLRLAPARR
jgi:general secretion pathway protein I